MCFEFVCLLFVAVVSIFFFAILLLSSFSLSFSLSLSHFLLLFLSFVHPLLLCICLSFRLSVCLSVFVSTTQRQTDGEFSWCYSPKCYMLINQISLARKCVLAAAITDLRLHTCTVQGQFFFCSRGRGMALGGGGNHFYSRKISLAPTYLPSFKHRFARASMHFAGTPAIFCSDKIGFATT